jgi:hypothetical protein
MTAKQEYRRNAEAFAKTKDKLDLSFRMISEMTGVGVDKCFKFYHAKKLHDEMAYLILCQWTENGEPALILCPWRQTPTSATAAINYGY